MSAGQVLGGRYELRVRLGAGGAGTVWRGYDPVFDREVAVKLIALDGDFMSGGENDTPIQRFRREARAAARLEHPNIVARYDFGTAEADGVAYLVMELVDGASVAERLRRIKAGGGTGFDELTAITYAMQVCAGLAVAHRAGLVHRDLKPSNLMVSDDSGVLKIVDFGIARAAEQSRLTRTGSYLGTLPYMAPEQMEAEPIDGRADLYSLGCVIHEMVSGRSPYDATTPMQWMAAHQLGTPARLRQHAPHASAALESVVQRLLAKSPTYRPADADVVRGLLAEIEHTLSRAGTVVREADQAEPTVPAGMTVPVGPTLPAPPELAAGRADTGAGAASGRGVLPPGGVPGGTGSGPAMVVAPVSPPVAPGGGPMPARPPVGTPPGAQPVSPAAALPAAAPPAGAPQPVSPAPGFPAGAPQPVSPASGFPAGAPQPVSPASGFPAGAPQPVSPAPGFPAGAPQPVSPAGYPGSAPRPVSPAAGPGGAGMQVLAPGQHPAPAPIGDTRGRSRGAGLPPPPGGGRPLGPPGRTMPPAGPPPRRKRSPAVMILVIVLLVAIATGGVGYVLWRNSNANSGGHGSGQPSGPVTPSLYDCFTSAWATQIDADLNTIFSAGDQVQPVSCDTAHTFEIVRLSRTSGKTAAASSPPTATSPSAYTLYQYCAPAANDFLGDDWRSGYDWVGLVVPSQAAWNANARWYACVVMPTANWEGTISETSTTLKDGLRGDKPAAIRCFGTATGAPGPVPCTDPHTDEAVGVFHAPNGVYPGPGETGVDKIDGPGCQQLVGRYLGFNSVGDYHNANVGYSWWPQTEEQWKLGNRSSLCAAHAYPKGTTMRNSVALLGNNPPAR